MTLEEIKVIAIGFIGVFIQRFMNNPIGTFTALILLLYTFEKYRAQRLDRIEKQKKAKNGKQTE